MVPDRAGKTPFLVAKQLTLHEFGSQRAAIQCDKRFCRPVAELVNRLRHQFLAGAAFAGDEDTGGRWRTLSNQTIQFLHRPGLSNQEAATTLLRRAFFRLVRQVLAKLAQVAFESLLVDRLAKQVGDACPHGARRVRHGRVGTHQVNLHDLAKVNRLEQLERVASADPVVQQGDFRHAPQQCFVRIIQRRDRFRVITVATKNSGESAGFVAVVDNECNGQEYAPWAYCARLRKRRAANQRTSIT
ncbi:MAG: hypothetical protein U5K76_09965 [Woeseiaceae bacterium]|nr:hypothetical protein [Woeseiaceae bacterium]